jgi:pyruvate,orthophosphate dikinase
VTSSDTAIFEIGIVGSPAGSVDVMGFKAYNLSRLAQMGLPVPQAFVLGTPWCQRYFAESEVTLGNLRLVLAERMSSLERATGLTFGGARKPLLVSVRSGAPVSMPGMMDTLLNIGLCESTLRGMLRLTGNPRLVWDSYRRLVHQYAEVVCGADPRPFRIRLQESLARKGIEDAGALDFRDLMQLTRDSLEIFEEIVGKPFPQEPSDQLAGAAAAVFSSWQSARAVEYRRMSEVPDTPGTAVTVQRMVFGNAGGTSGAGVGFTRDPDTGANRFYLDFRFNSQGEDIVSGRHDANDAAQLERALPNAYRQLADVCGVLEREFRDAQEFEFTVQEGRLFLLQTRSAKRTPWAALRIAVEQVREALITPAEALRQLAGIEVEKIERRRLDAADGAPLLAEALPASTGGASGHIALDVDAVERCAAQGKPAILVREDMTTADIAAIAAAAGVLTKQGGRTAHAAVVARQLGKVCLVGCRELSIDQAARQISLGGRLLHEGEIICLDADSGRIYRGEPKTIVEKPVEYLAEVARWQRAVRRHAHRYCDPLAQSAT